MNKRFRLLFIIAMVLVMEFSQAIASTDFENNVQYSFEPEITNYMNLKWYDTSINRALLSLTLSLNIMDQKVMNEVAVFYGLLENPSYVGKVVSGLSVIYIVVGAFDDRIILIVYTPQNGEASFMLKENTDGTYVSEVKMEMLMSELCSDYIKNESSDMLEAVEQIKLLLN